MENDILEKVIKGLTLCEISITQEDCIGCGCPYLIYDEKCLSHLFQDSIELLKTQKLDIEPREICHGT